MTLLERNLTDEEYEKIYKNVYPDPWTRELLETCKMFLKNWGNHYPKTLLKLMKKKDRSERIHLKNAISYWEKKLNP